MAKFIIKLSEASTSNYEQTVCYLLSFKRRTQGLQTKYKLRIDEWDEKQQVIVISPGSERESYLNKVQCRINNDKNLFKRVLRELEETETSYSISDIMKLFNKYRSGQTFFSFMDHEIKTLLEQGRSGTAQNYIAAKSSFLEFVKDEELNLNAITEDLILEYEKWLRGSQLARNTTSFYMRQLRSVYNKAVRQKLVNQNSPFMEAYTGIDRTRKRAVKASTITHLAELDLKGKFSLELARDLFLFSFYMRGIAFVDMAYLKKSDIKNGEIHYCRHKTDIPLDVKLENCMLEIIDRYAAKTKDDYLLPIITETDEAKAYKQYQNKRSYYNKLLKKISRILNLEIPLTSYVSRHTWATVARNMDIPISIISAGMGHTSETTTRIYLCSLEASTVDRANHKVIEQIISPKRIYSKK